MTTATTVMPTRDVTVGDAFVRISGQGFPLVFVHGFTTTSEFWRGQAEEFSKAYRVIRINLPGHGASPAPTSRSYCLEDFVEDVARVFRELSIADTRGSLSQIKVPTLVIAGEEDLVTPPQELEILAKGISDSTLSLIPGAGHFSMLENPVAFNRILRGFLDGLPRGAS